MLMIINNNGVIVKLNWSLPKDSVWINGETIKCDNVTQILLLLKSSQFIQCDLFYPFQQCYDFNVLCKDNTINNNSIKFDRILVLRKHSNLFLNREFRCFVFNKELICFCQRNLDFYKDLQNNELKNKIKNTIIEFYNNIKNKLNLLKLNNFVFDCYINKSFKLFIIDFNPLYEITDSLLYSWFEICKLINKNYNKIINNNINNNDIQTRYINKNKEKKIEYQSNSPYRYTIDAVDLTSDEKPH